MKFKYYKTQNQEATYNIVSLNYDLIFEKVEQNLKQALPEYQSDHSYDTSLLLNTNLNNEKDGFLDLIKLHGSADEPESIVPPTWNKILSRDKSLLWKKAYEFLSNSYEIRVLGYSLPISDVYFRYFLMSCIRASTRLEKFQVFSLDPTGYVQKNYTEFFEPEAGLLEFYHTDVLDYLKKIYDSILSSSKDERGTFYFYGLENGHETFLKQHSGVEE